MVIYSIQFIFNSLFLSYFALSCIILVFVHSKVVFPTFTRSVLIRLFIFGYQCEILIDHLVIPTVTPVQFHFCLQILLIISFTFVFRLNNPNIFPIIQCVHCSLSDRKFFSYFVDALMFLMLELIKRYMKVFKHERNNHNSVDMSKY